jgi:hypothetical protein
VQISWEDLKDAEAAVGEFGGDNRAGDQPALQTMLPCAEGVPGDYKACVLSAFRPGPAGDGGAQAACGA